MPVETITPAQVHSLQQSTPLDILDVRTPAEFAVAHIPGATLVPLDSFNPATLAAQRDGKPLYIVCEKGGRAAQACQICLDAGLANVRSIQGGTQAWIHAGLPVICAGGRTPSLERQVRILAGTLVLLGTILAWTVHIAFLALPAFIGAGLTFAGITDFCGMALLLAKLPWNRRAPSSCTPSIPA